MELQSYLAILWRRKWVIAIVTLIIACGAAIATYLTVPVYVSTTTLRAITIGGEVAGGRIDAAYTERLLNTYGTIVTGRSVLSELRQRFNLPQTPNITVELVRGTELMRIRAEATDPAVARDLAEAAAELLMHQANEQFSSSGRSTQEILQLQLDQVGEELAEARQQYQQLATQTPDDRVGLEALSQSIQLKERTQATLLTQYETARLNEALRANSIYIVERANLPTSPSAPRTGVNLLLGLLGGLVAGVMLAFLFENQDATLRTREQIEGVTQPPIIGEIPAAKDRLQIVHSNNGHRPQMEAFRRLRVNILAAETEVISRTVLVTSAEAGAGKTTVAANLAVTIAQSGRRVVLVDCNMHNPQLHTLFDLPNETGLTSVLTGELSVVGATLKTRIPRLHVLTSGHLLHDELKWLGPPEIVPAGLMDRLSQGVELLGSPKMAAILRELKAEYDTVLLDTAAMLTATDAAVLVPLVDEVVLVVARDRSQREAIRSIQRQLENVHAKSIGVVVNKAA
jgi:polysaccharide biosynthesis transport protein